MVGIEHIDELVQMSIKNVQADDPELLSSGRIKLVGESGDIKVMPLTNTDIETAQTAKDFKSCVYIYPQWEMEGLATQTERRMMLFMLVQLQLLFLRL